MWWAVLGTAAGCYAAKLAGLAVPASVLAHPVVRRAAELVPVALLAALVAVQVVAGVGDGATDAGPQVVIDARAGSLVAAGALLMLRAPFLVVVVGAAVVAALLRLG
ncbi:AzlD domain-containing protein [Nocardioidaceae bacterium]|nr:AzlD domain-containing protein [Nocardioidaceae bacterium]